MDKVFFLGTHRCREPGQTLAAIGPLLGEYEITRLADVTGLDTLGIPVVMAIRPRAATLTVSQGKGATLDAAAVSAAMEAIELWHGEFGVPDAACRGAAVGLELGYRVAELTDLPGSLVTEHTVLDWIPARTISGTSTMVPRDLVRMGPRKPGEWAFHALTASSNGLASGNTRAEAIAHALHELIERDACAAFAASPPPSPVSVDLATVPDYCAAMVCRIQEGGGGLQVVAVPNLFGIPCFLAYLRVEDAFWIASGSGAHSDAAVALSRAITEACQSRLTVIAGSRDDITPELYRPLAEAALPLAAEARTKWRDAIAGLGWACGTDEEEAEEASRRISEVTGAEPIVVDLTERPELAVVKVLAPQLRLRPSHELPRSGAA
jgi:ribosomal protein S12 methylthiotransferase accessory factor